MAYAPTLTHEPGGTTRQVCARCFRTVGTLPNGEHIAYRTEVRTWPDGDVRRFHFCTGQAWYSCVRRTEPEAVPA